MGYSDSALNFGFSWSFAGTRAGLTRGLLERAAARFRMGTVTYEGFNAFCRALPATTYVVQWGGSHVWKVGGKVFAIGGWQIDEPSFTFKVSDIAYEMLKEQPGLRPAPYLASRGMNGSSISQSPDCPMARCRTISANHIPSSHRACRRRGG